MKVKFGDVVKDVKENVDRANNPYEFYVAGDHMDSEDFRIHRRGKFATDDVGPAFVRIFHPGQVLYGSRRTYLKKVCVADFEGVCANTTFVLETKDEGVLLQKLLPFLMLSEGFTDWSVKHSKGSTNPYVLFSDLADYEFALPSIDRQRELAELLWAANDLKEKYKKLITASDEMLKAKFREMFGAAGVQGAECEVVPLKDVCAILTDGTHQPPKFCDSGIPFLLVSNIKDFELTYDTDKFVTEEQYAELNKRTPVAKGDVLLSVVGSFGNPALVKEDRPFCFQRHIAYLKPNYELVLSEYLYFVLLSDSVQKQFGIVAKGCAQKTITLTDLKAVTIPLPPLDLQRQFVEIAAQEEKVKANLKKSIADVDNIIKGLING